VHLERAIVDQTGLARIATDSLLADSSRHDVDESAARQGAMLVAVLFEYPCSGLDRDAERKKLHNNENIAGSAISYGLWTGRALQVRRTDALSQAACQPAFQGPPTSLISL
jgi:hypothetical protein